MNSLSWPLRVYVAAVVLAGVPALMLGTTAIGPMSAADVMTAAVLFVLAWGAQRYPIHLGPKLKVTVEDGATFAAALVLSPFVAMIVAGGSSLLATRFDGKTPLYDRLFNASAALLAIGGASATYQLLRATHSSRRMPSLSSPPRSSAISCGPSSSMARSHCSSAVRS